MRLVRAATTRPHAPLRNSTLEAVGWHECGALAAIELAAIYGTAVVSQSGTAPWAAALVGEEHRKRRGGPDGSSARETGESWHVQILRHDTLRGRAFRH
jgi:hypothetical protein